MAGTESLETLTAPMGASPRALKDARDLAWLSAVFFAVGLGLLSHRELAPAGALLALTAGVGYVVSRRRHIRLLELAKHEVILRPDVVEITRRGEVQFSHRILDLGGLRLVPTGPSVFVPRFHLLDGLRQPIAEIEFWGERSTVEGSSQRKLLAEMIRRVPPGSEQPCDDLGPYGWRPAPWFIAALFFGGIASAGSSFAYLSSSVWTLAQGAAGEWSPARAIVALCVGLFGLALLLLSAVDGYRWLMPAEKMRAAVRADFERYLALPEVPATLQPGVWYIYRGREKKLREQKILCNSMYACIGLLQVVMVIGFVKSSVEKSEPIDWSQVIGMLCFLTVFAGIVRLNQIYERANLLVRVRVTKDGLEVHRGDKVLVVDPEPFKKIVNQDGGLLTQRWRFRRGKTRVDLDLRFLVPEEEISA